MVLSVLFGLEENGVVLRGFGLLGIGVIRWLDVDGGGWVVEYVVDVWEVVGCLCFVCGKDDGWRLRLGVRLGVVWDWGWWFGFVWS